MWVACKSVWFIDHVWQALAIAFVYTQFHQNVNYRLQESQLTTLFSCKPLPSLSLILGGAWRRPFICLYMHVFICFINCGLANGAASANQYQKFMSNMMPPWLFTTITHQTYDTTHNTCKSSTRNCRFITFDVFPNTDVFNKYHCWKHK